MSTPLPEILIAEEHDQLYEVWTERGLTISP
jgi:hypothetical protein